MNSEISTPYVLPCFGAHVVPLGVRFALWHRHATRLWLLLFKKRGDSQPDREIELRPDRHRHGDAWAVTVQGVGPGQLYAWRAEGPDLDSSAWILDPWARGICGETGWGEPGSRKPGFSIHHGAAFPKAMVTSTSFDWGQDQPPRIPREKLVVYEAHVRGFTRHSSSRVKSPGSYAGLTEKIPYLCELGVNAIELLPMFEFDEMEYYTAGDVRSALRNFWGYSTVGFFAPNGRYATRSRSSNRSSRPRTPPE
jgi:glycogen operon protein